MGVPWFTLPPSHHSPQPSPSLPALAQLRPRPREKGVCLPGNPSPCNRVSRDTARDALTSGPKAQASPPAGTEPSRADRRAGAALWPWRPDSASACRKRARSKAGWRSGGGAPRSPSRGCRGPPSPYQHQGPSTSGKSWLSTEEGREDRLQPRRVRADPKEDRERPRGSSIHSTAHAGSEATEGWGKGFQLGSYFCQEPHFHPVLPLSFLRTPSPSPKNLSIHLVLSTSLKAPILTALTFRPPGPFCGRQSPPSSSRYILPSKP